MARATARLYLLCFAYYRFRQIHDNLIEAFIHLVDHYEQQAKQAAEDAIQRAVTEASEHLQAAGQVLSLFVDASIPSDAPFTVVQQQAFALLDPARFPLVTDYLALVEPGSFEPVTPGYAGEALLLAAARSGRTRLIDNMPLVLGAQSEPRGRPCC